MKFYIHIIARKINRPKMDWQKGEIK